MTWSSSCSKIALAKCRFVIRISYLLDIFCCMHTIVVVRVVRVRVRVRVLVHVRLRVRVRVRVYIDILHTSATRFEYVLIDIAFEHVQAVSLLHLARVCVSV